MAGEFGFLTLIQSREGPALAIKAMNLRSPIRAGLLVARKKCPFTEGAEMLTDEKVRERAHRLWREAGEPCGRAKEFWRRAREQLSREDLDAPPNLQDPAG